MDEIRQGCRPAFAVMVNRRWAHGWTASSRLEMERSKLEQVSLLMMRCRSFRADDRQRCRTELYRMLIKQARIQPVFLFLTYCLGEHRSLRGAVLRGLIVFPLVFLRMTVRLIILVIFGINTAFEHNWPVANNDDCHNTCIVNPKIA
jgi:hypothetical protein